MNCIQPRYLKCGGKAPLYIIILREREIYIISYITINKTIESKYIFSNYLFNTKKQYCILTPVPDSSIDYVSFEMLEFFCEL